MKWVDSSYMEKYSEKFPKWDNQKSAEELVSEFKDALKN